MTANTHEKILEVRGLTKPLALCYVKKFMKVNYCPAIKVRLSESLKHLLFVGFWKHQSIKDIYIPLPHR